MSFAKKILKKFGWKEGHGLGKNSDGISKPLKASLKFDNAGLGVDKAAEFNNHWWERVFNEAANNVQIGKDGDQVSVNIKNDESVEITTKDYSIRKLKKKKPDSYDSFLLSATLTNTGDEVTKPDKIEVDDIKVPAYKTLTDEELFAACGGRTAHKGARHGLKMSGKLARIERQEKEMLLKITSANCEESSQPWTVVKNKKTKKKNVTSDEVPQVESIDDESKLKSMLYTAEYCIKSKKKRKEKKKTEEELSECIGSFSMENEKEDNVLLKICDNSKAIKKSKKAKKSKKEENPDSFKTYREVSAAKEAPDDSLEGETPEIAPDKVVDDIEGKTKRKKSKKCKHGIDKEAKEAHKKAKKLKKSLQHVTEDMERTVLVTA